MAKLPTKSGPPIPKVAEPNPGWDAMTAAQREQERHLHQYASDTAKWLHEKCPLIAFEGGRGPGSWYLAPLAYLRFSVKVGEQSLGAYKYLGIADLKIFEQSEEEYRKQLLYEFTHSLAQAIVEWRPSTEEAPDGG